jgi:hypothetical protein
MNRSEQALHRAVVEFMRLCVPPPPDGPWWTHPHNEGRRGRAEAGIAKAMGQQAGAPDIIGCHQGRFFAIELKVPTGRLAPAQNRAHHAISLAGGVTSTCRSIDDVAGFLEGLGVRLRGRLAA